MHPRLAFDPQARTFLLRGFNHLAALMEVALGPRGRLVAVARANPRQAPELLNDGATLARRFLGLPNRFETMGAFLARHIAWRMEESVGDGATTAVVIARQVLNESARLIAAGHNVMDLRRGLEKALKIALHALQNQAHPLDQPAQISALATTITGDETLGRYLEEIFDTVGPYGAIDVRTHYGRGHDRQYIHGAFWNQGWVSSKTRGVLPTLAIKAPGLGSEKNEILHDLAVLTGGKLFLQENGEPLAAAELTDLGQADEVRAIRSGFTLIGGQGRPAAIRQRQQALRTRIPTAAPGCDRDRLVERAGKLLGGVGLLKVGTATELEQEYLKERAKEAVQTVRLGLQEGIVPGGGVAFLRCLPALAILHSALQAPLQAILRNSGFDPAPILARLAAAGNGAGFDVQRGEMVDVLAAHIVDPIKVLTTALQTGVSGALMGITTEVLVHKPRHNRDEAVDFKP